MRRIGKVEVVGNLLDGFVAEFQQTLCLDHQASMDKFKRAYASMVAAELI